MVPDITLLPIKQILLSSMILLESLYPLCFSIGRDSPVKLDSLINKSFDSRILMSPGIISPPESLIISPLTTSYVSTSISLLSLITNALLLTSSSNFLVSLSCLYSSRKWSNPENTIITAIMIIVK